MNNFEKEEIQDGFSYSMVQTNFDLAMIFVNGKKFKNFIGRFSDDFDNNLKYRTFFSSIKYDKEAFRKRIYLSYKGNLFAVYGENKEAFQVNS